MVNPHWRSNSSVLDPVLEWRKSVADYKRLVSFSFENEEDFGQALEAFDENGELSEVPFDVIPVDTVVVPQEASTLWTNWLTDRRIQFTKERVIESRELPAEEIAALRRQNYRPAP